MTTTNVVQIPFREDGEPISEWRVRMAAFHRNWREQPQPIPTAADREMIASWPLYKQPTDGMVRLPLIGIAAWKISA